MLLYPSIYTLPSTLLSILSTLFRSERTHSGAKDLGAESYEFTPVYPSPV